MVRPRSNPPNPWASTYVEWIGEPPAAELEIFEEEARSLLTANDSPDVPFHWSVNPYRGCYHGCAYCYARPSHQYLDWGAGTDFERKIVIKVNAPALLRRELERPSWRGEAIHFSGNTDCYQPVEASYGLTRRCLEVCLAYRNPVTLVTKGSLIRRDLDLLSRLARDARVAVQISIPFLDLTTCRALEPYAPSPAQRFETLNLLADAGIPSGVMVAPIIPGLNDREIPSLLEQAREAGATTASMALLRLPGEVLPVFERRLQIALPELAGKVWAGLREVRGGKLNDSTFGKRMRGHGPRWQAIRDLFEIHCRRLSLTPPIADDAPSTFRRPAAQGDLFGLWEGGSGG